MPRRIEVGVDIFKTAYWRCPECNAFQCLDLDIWDEEPQALECVKCGAKVEWSEDPSGWFYVREEEG